MSVQEFDIIYGPVASWRLGVSLGVDLLGSVKTCNLDCLYCQLGETKKYVEKRNLFVPTEKVLGDIRAVWPLEIDWITFSGMGEPTLASNLGEVIQKVKEITDKKVAVITNSSLMGDPQVRSELREADAVFAKLDAPSQISFYWLSGPSPKVSYPLMVEGLQAFREEYHGNFAIQIMFTPNNQHEAEALAKKVLAIKPDEVQINTPLRPCREKPLTEKALRRLAVFFEPLKVKCVYDFEHQKVVALDSKKAKLRREA